MEAIVQQINDLALATERNAEGIFNEKNMAFIRDMKEKADKYGKNIKLSDAQIKYVEGLRKKITV